MEKSVLPGEFVGAPRVSKSLRMNVLLVELISTQRVKSAHSNERSDGEIAGAPCIRLPLLMTVPPQELAGTSRNNQSLLMSVPSSKACRTPRVPAVSGQLRPARRRRRLSWQHGGVPFSFPASRPATMPGWARGTLAAPYFYPPSASVIAPPRPLTARRPQAILSAHANIPGQPARAPRRINV